MADVTTRLAKARKHFMTLHTFWKHTGLSTAWKLRIYNAVFVPRIACGMESAALTTADLHRLEAFHSQSLRKIQRIKASFYTKVLTDNPTHKPSGTRESALCRPTPRHTPHSQGTVKVVWSRFESNFEQPGKELRFYEGFCV